MPTVSLGISEKTRPGTEVRKKMKMCHFRKLLNLNSFFGEVAWGQKTSQRTIINIRKYPFSVPISPYIHNLSFVFLLDFDRRNNLKFNCFLEKKKDETIISLFPSQNVFSSRYCLVFGKSLATALLNLARKPFEISIMSNDQDNGLVHHACVPQCVAGS